MSDRVTRSEFARRLGITEGAVRKHIRRGMYQPGRDNLLDFDECKLAWETQRDPDAHLKGMAGGNAVRRDAERARETGVPETGLMRARIAQAVVRAQRDKLALDKSKGELIATADAFSAVRLVVATITERLDGAAAQIGARAAGGDAVSIERTAREVLNAVRQEIASMSNSVREVADATRSKS